MKYRVKRIEWEDTTIYYPQYKKFLFWRNYYKNNASASDDYSTIISFRIEKQAWEYIKNHKEWPLISYKYERK